MYLHFVHGHEQNGRPSGIAPTTPTSNLLYLCVLPSTKCIACQDGVDLTL